MQCKRLMEISDNLYTPRPVSCTVAGNLEGGDVKNQTNSEILTPDECADLLRVSTRTVRKLSDNGEIPSFRVGNQVRFLRADVIDRLRGQAEDGKQGNA
tara:strand:- start:2585 stop:2881 length:297 start_codon:yes stop_codon:yes gene_type:complete